MRIRPRLVVACLSAVCLLPAAAGLSSSPALAEGTGNDAPVTPASPTVRRRIHFEQDARQLLDELKLRGLDPEARYAVRDLDAKVTVEASGRELMEEGFLLSIPDQPGSAIVEYRRMERTGRGP
jgi:hypothetical protein